MEGTFKSLKKISATRLMCVSILLLGDAIFSCSVVLMLFSYADIRLCLNLDIANTNMKGDSIT